MTPADKETFVRALHGFVQAHGPRQDRACVLYAAMGVIMLEKQGIRALLQAGNASYLYKAKECDDGGDSHFAYVFDPEQPRSAERIRQGMIPEIHCWIGLPETQEVVDVTTRFLPASLVDMNPTAVWTAPRPPDFFWGTADDMPPGWNFECKVEAMRYAFSHIQMSWPLIYIKLRDIARRTLCTTAS